jgi:hypothetical protein
MRTTESRVSSQGRRGYRLCHPELPIPFAFRRPSPKYNNSYNKLLYIQKPGVAIVKVAIIVKCMRLDYPRYLISMGEYDFPAR